MMSGEDDAPPPEWFARAVAAPRESRFVEVEGCAIHYLRWGDPARPGLVFVPASGGHAHWYAHIAPLLAAQFHVVAIDLGGCGDSGRRAAYTQASMAAEIMAVCADSGMRAAAVPPTLIGHSAGAQCAVRTAMAHGTALLGVIAVDGLRYAALEKDQAVKILNAPGSAPRPAPRPARVYATREEAVSRFRLMPAPLIPISNGYIVDYIARHSFHAVAGGWAAKYDTAQAATITLGLELKDVLKDLHCHAAVIYAEHTHLADDTAVARMTALNAGLVPVFVIPGTSHYPAIDSPFAFVAAINGIVLSWAAAALRPARL